MFGLQGPEALDEFLKAHGLGDDDNLLIIRAFDCAPSRAAVGGTHHPALFLTQGLSVADWLRTLIRSIEKTYEDGLWITNQGFLSAEQPAPGLIVGQVLAALVEAEKASVKLFDASLGILRAGPHRYQHICLGVPHGRLSY